MFRPNLIKIFKETQADPDICDGCEFLVYYIEKYEIGDQVDSSQEYQCSGNYLQCHRVDTIAEEVEDFLQDNQDMVKYLEGGRL